MTHNYNRQYNPHQCSDFDSLGHRHEREDAAHAFAMACAHDYKPLNLVENICRKCSDVRFNERYSF